MSDPKHPDMLGEAECHPHNSSHNPTGKLHISIIDTAHNLHRVVVPLPPSYESATFLAAEFLRPFMTKRDIAIGDISLRYADKSRGKTSWSTIPQHFWSRVVGDGDEVRVFHREDEFRTGQSSTSHGSLATLTFTHSHKTHRYAIILPETHREAISLAFKAFGSMFKNPQSMTPDIYLTTRMMDHHGKWVDDVRLPMSQWKEVTKKLSEDGTPFEIIVNEYQEPHTSRFFEMER